MAAIQYGCPIVTTLPRVHIPDFVHGQNMLLVLPSDNVALTTTLRQLHATPEIAQRLRNGATQLAAHFDWQQIARDTITFFERVLRGAT
jgi:glycosyltransferase involved in cell wall biosynthesis